jgi:hypothetical protein
MARRRGSGKSPPNARTSGKESLSKTTLAAIVSGVVLLVLTAFLTPLGAKVVNAAWPDRHVASSSAPGSPPAATALPASGGCRSGGPPLSVILKYDFTGSVWWATPDKLPPSVLDQLNRVGGSDPSSVLAQYQPVESEFGAGTLLKLVTTGCGPMPVVITNMYAAVSRRASPLSGSVVFWPPQGNLDLTTLAFDLDSSGRPAALDYDASFKKRGGSHFTEHAIQVAAGENVPFEIMGLTTRSYIEWSIVIAALVDGHPWEFTVALADGSRIKTTANAPTYQSAYMLNNVTARYEATDPGQIATVLRGT